ncbi:MAG: protein translocase subunit SecF [Candidatus Paceibacterota bacterium]
MNIIKYRGIFISVSAVLVVASIACLIIFGFRPSIDFTGGTLWQVRVSDQTQIVQEQNIQDVLVTVGGVESPVVYKELTSDSFLIKTQTLSEVDHARLLEILKNKFSSVEEIQYQSIGPTIGDQLRSRAIWASILVLLGISLYITFSFRKVSHPVPSWKYGIATLIALFHDAIIPVGILAVLGKTHGIEIDTNFVVAVLVIIGFSVHDTIVVFDRIRENLLIHRSTKQSFDYTVNESITQTMARSINTSLTLVLMLVALIIFGPANLRVFTGVLLIGTVFGTYSSIFLASPLLTLWHKFDIKN